MPVTILYFLYLAPLTLRYAQVGEHLEYRTSNTVFLAEYSFFEYHPGLFGIRAALIPSKEKEKNQVYITSKMNTHSGDNPEREGEWQPRHTTAKPATTLTLLQSEEVNVKLVTPCTRNKLMMNALLQWELGNIDSALGLVSQAYLHFRSDPECGWFSTSPVAMT
ncbi:hypothetical protein Pelo_47 [Pelomyxa schiedti]|nr:hypothetical protein Pelo_47 [Pelomyxa schiedti]